MNILFLAYEVESILILELSKLYKNKKDNISYVLNADFWTFTNNKNFYKKHYNNSNCDFYNNFEEEYFKGVSLNNLISIGLEKKIITKANKLI